MARILRESPRVPPGDRRTVEPRAGRLLERCRPPSGPGGAHPVLLCQRTRGRPGPRRACPGAVAGRTATGLAAGDDAAAVDARVPGEAPGRAGPDLLPEIPRRP